MLGNFCGDFVKGTLDHWPNAFAQGVRLHRQIDRFTDDHPLVMELKQQCPPVVRRFSGIALDIYFDHLLLTHWPVFTEQTAAAVLADFYQQLACFSLPISPRFQLTRANLLEHQWLIDMHEAQSCLKSLQSIENRLSRQIRFAQAAFAWLMAEQHSINQAFLHFYPLLIRYIKNQCQQQERL